MEKCKKVRKQLMIDIPMDLLVYIFLRLPVESLCRTKLVCKTFLNIIDDLSFIKQHMFSLMTDNDNEYVSVHEVPQLMCFAEQYSESSNKEDEKIYVTLRSVRYDGRVTLSNTGFEFTRLMYGPSIFMKFVFYNLFCMEVGDGNCYLIDPLHKQFISLPNDDIIGKYGSTIIEATTTFWYGMGYDAITNTYKLVRISCFYNKDNDPYLTNENMLVHILVLGTNIWREISSHPPADVYMYGLCAYGDMHWLISKTKGDVATEILVSFDFKREVFHWTSTPPELKSIGILSENCHLHLLRLKGSMAIVETIPTPEEKFKVEIWVMKDYAKKEWIREFNANFNMHTLNSLDLFCATCGEWEHGIFFNDSMYDATRFFLNLRHSSVNIVAYPIETETENFVHIMSYTRSLISLKDFYPVDYKNIDDLNSG